MSSTGQAFVKSFARRSQTNSPNDATTETGNQKVSPLPVERPSKIDSDAMTAKTGETHTAELWVDSFDDTPSRLDQGSSRIAAPHLPTRSLQHTHTAYDASGSEPETSDTNIPTNRYSRIGNEQAETREAPQQTAASESPEAILTARIARVLEPNQPEQRLMQDIADAEGALAEVADQNHEASERLSDFETSETLRPSWEVEVFDIPQAVADLFFEETLFQDLSSRMKEASQGGLRTMLMTSAMTGEGRTTVAIGVALAAAFSGLRVALVDGDLAEPTLAEELRLDLDHSWVESVRRGVPIKEVAVHAIEDNLTLIPLLPTDSGRQATAVECARMLESLKPSFDLIVVDGPTADAKDIRMLGSVIDSVIIVHDVNQSSDAAADLLAARLQRSGIDGVGIVENFV
jgi:Mrp family chromosome partitioning ATPase